MAESTAEKSKLPIGLSADESIIISMTTTKISDLNFYCLNKIFNYLTIRDIVYLAEAHFPDGLTSVKETKQFEYCIQKAFQKQQERNAIFNSNPTIHLQILRHFGPLITQMDLYHSDNQQYYKEVENAIIKHCRTTLTGFTFYFVDSNVMDEIEQPFEKVQTVKFVGGHLGAKISQFNKWFPRMTSLHILGAFIDELQFVQKHFPFLEQFAVCNDLNGYELDLELDRTETSFRSRFFNSPISNFNNLNLKSIINLNPQLNNLYITHDDNYCSKDTITIDSDLLKFIKQNLPKLESLSLNMNPGDSLSLREIVEFNNLKQLKVGAFHDGIIGCIFEGEFLTETYIKANKLQVLKLSGVLEGEPQYEFISTFICNFPSIKELEISNFNDFDIANEHMSVMYNFLDHLEAIYVFDDNESDKEQASHYRVSRRGRNPGGLFAGVRIDQVK